MSSDETGNEIRNNSKRSHPTSPTVQENDFRKRHNISQGICSNSPSTELLIDLLSEPEKVKEAKITSPLNAASSMNIVVPSSLVDVHVSASPIPPNSSNGTNEIASTKMPIPSITKKGAYKKENDLNSKLPGLTNRPTFKKGKPVPLPIMSQHLTQRIKKSCIPLPKRNTRATTKEQMNPPQQNYKDKI